MSCLFQKGVTIGFTDVNGRPMKNGDLIKYIPTGDIYRIEYDVKSAAFVAVKGSVRHPLCNTYATAWYVIEPVKPVKIVVDNPLKPAHHHHHHKKWKPRKNLQVE